MSRKRPLEGNTDRKGSSDGKPERTLAAQELERLLVNVISHEIGYGLQCIDRKRQAEQKAWEEKHQKELEQQARPDHLRLLDVLQRFNISSRQPIEAIFLAIPIGEYHTNEVVMQFAAEWQLYKQALYKLHGKELQRTAAEKPGFFRQFTHRLTFDTVFKNDMWIADDPTLNRADYPTLDSDPVIHREQHLERQRTLAESQPATVSLPPHPPTPLFSIAAERDALLEEVQAYAHALTTYADVHARFILFEHALEIHLDLGLFHDTTAQVTKLRGEFGFLEPGIDLLPVVHATGALKMLCEALRTKWTEVFRGQRRAPSFDEVRQFLVQTENDIDALRVKYLPTFNSIDYDEEFSEYLRLHTQMSRAQSIHIHLQSLLDQVSKTTREIAPVLDLIDAPAATEPRDKKAKVDHDLESLITWLTKARDQFAATLKQTQDAIAGDDRKGSDSEQQLALKRSNVFTAAMHLDFVEWVRSILTAIGRSFLVREDTPGQLAERTQMAIADSKQAAHGYIDKVLEHEQELCKKEKDAMHKELTDGFQWLDNLLERLRNTKAFYHRIHGEMQNYWLPGTQITLHPEWLKLVVCQAPNPSPGFTLVTQFFQAMGGQLRIDETKDELAESYLLVGLENGERELVPPGTGDLLRHIPRSRPDETSVDRIALTLKVAAEALLTIYYGNGMS